MAETWPSLDLAEWKDTYATLHMWTQVIGKIRVKLSPPVNHWWHSVLYVNSYGLTTLPIPYRNGMFEIQFDFIDHKLLIHTADGAIRTIELRPQSVASFYQEVMNQLQSLGIEVKINPMPQEVPSPIPFHEDHDHASYDAEYARRHWRILIQVDRLMKVFRGGFIGKCSPVHFFWGSFDIAVTRFSGRRAPERPDSDAMTREAYSHEVCSVGFWPGSQNINGPAFYAYAAPEPAGFKSGKILPSSAFYNPETQGYILMYEDVRKSREPDRMILDFFQSTYDLGASLGKWDRATLERK